MRFQQGYMPVDEFYLLRFNELTVPEKSIELSTAADSPPPFENPTMDLITEFPFSNKVAIWDLR